MRNKVCVLRDAAEIEALRKLQELQRAIRAGKMTEAEADAAFQPFLADLPRCEDHHHKTRREANKLELQGALHFLPGFEEHYAQEDPAKECRATGRTFYPGLMFSGDAAIGRLEMYSYD